MSVVTRTEKNIIKWFVCGSTLFHKESHNKSATIAFVLCCVMLYVVLAWMFTCKLHLTFIHAIFANFVSNTMLVLMLRSQIKHPLNHNNQQTRIGKGGFRV